MTLELDVAGVSPGKADADIECAISKIRLSSGRREAKFNVTLAAYDRVSIQEKGLAYALPLVSGEIQVRFFDSSLKVLLRSFLYLCYNATVWIGRGSGAGWRNVTSTTPTAPARDLERYLEERIGNACH